MNLTKEQKTEMTKTHDTFCHYYNEFMRDVTVLIWANENPTDEEKALAIEINVRSKIIAAQIQEMDAALDQLGIFRQTHRAHPEVQREAAKRYLNTN